ncbi:hypothetical protein AWZ03_009490 [Drosophila navojoa]|uniref:Uncharacterized protein n=1 Tax=Drosophila navojoa TaxID=7232 RepID=A0A484B8C2_DRONA|nr:hypothetical protein AWZ03_009490 [Drosophila navojoa]
MLHAAKHNAHVTCQRFQQQQQQQQQQLQQQQQRHEAAAAGRDLQALHSFLRAHTDQSAAAAAGVGIGCGSSCNNLRKALNVACHSGGNFHSTYAPLPAPVPDTARRTINLSVQYVSVSYRRRRRRRLLLLCGSLDGALERFVRT